MKTTAYRFRNIFGNFFGTRKFTGFFIGEIEKTPEFYKQGFLERIELNFSLRTGIDNLSQVQMFL